VFCTYVAYPMHILYGNIIIINNNNNNIYKVVAYINSDVGQWNFGDDFGHYSLDFGFWIYKKNYVHEVKL